MAGGNSLASPSHPLLFPPAETTPVLHVWVCLSDQWSSLCFILNFVKMASSSVWFFLVWHFWFHFRFNVNTNHVLWTQCAFMEHLASSTPGPQAGIPRSQGQCPVDPWCKQVPRAWAASRLALSETHPCTVWSVHSSVSVVSSICWRPCCTVGGHLGCVHGPEHTC